MRQSPAFSYTGLLLGCALACASEVPKRSFEFTYEATLTGLPAGKSVKVWVPVPTTTGDQTVTRVLARVQGARPEKGAEATEPTYGNRIFHAEATADDAGKVRLTFVYRVVRREVKGGTKADETPERLARYLEADALVPVGGKALDLLKGKTVPKDERKAARLLYDVVNGHMKYSKEGIGWGRGDSAWACDSRFGNCSDFHSLFISLARARKVPARFEIGFAIPVREGTIGGYHCWALFRSDGAWVPVDISEANKDPKRRDYYFGNLTPDRVAFSVGRDLVLVPNQAGRPINFLIYPHVEVDGKEWPQAKIEKRFASRDVE